VDAAAGRKAPLSLRGLSSSSSKLVALHSGAPPQLEILVVSAAAELRRSGVNSGFAELRRVLEGLLIRDRGAIVKRRALNRFGQSAQKALAAIRVRLAANATLTSGSSFRRSDECRPETCAGVELSFPLLNRRGR